MAQFGGYAHFGGACQFGGQALRGLVHHRLFRSLEPPGVFDDTPGTIRDDRLRTYATGLGDHSQAQLDALEREIFPGTAEQLLPEWETLFRVSPEQGATLAERQAVVKARWQEAMGCAPWELRELLVDLLNPTWAFWDRLDDADVCWRYTQRAGNGSIAEDYTGLTLSVGAAAHGDWDATEDNCPRLTIPVVDKTDGIVADATITAFGGSDDTAGGLALYQDAGSAWLFGLTQDGADTYLQVDRCENGTLSRAVARGIDITVYPVYLRIIARGGQVEFLAKYGSQESYSSVATRAQGHVSPVAVALWCRNEDPSYNAASTEFDDVRFRHDLAQHNVEIIETPANICPSGGEAGVFQVFVHREPTDDGWYSIKLAQRTANRCKLGHTLMLVGESDCFRCDDPYSLTNRDVLGS